MKKYEFTGEIDEFGWRRIRRLSDGLVGGWIQSEANLSHDGNCWVFDNARVLENGQVFGEAMVFKDAWVFGCAKVSGNAMVSDNAHVFGDANVSEKAFIFGDAQVGGKAIIAGKASVSRKAKVSGCAKVSGNAYVSGDAQVSGNAKVLGDARVSGGEWRNSPLFVQGSKHGATNCKPGFISIGCETHSFADWLANYESIGTVSRYCPETIEEYRNIIEFIIAKGV